MCLFGLFYGCLTKFTCNPAETRKEFPSARDVSVPSGERGRRRRGLYQTGNDDDVEEPPPPTQTSPLSLPNLPGDTCILRPGALRAFLVQALMSFHQSRPPFRSSSTMSNSSSTRGQIPPKRSGARFHYVGFESRNPGHQHRLPTKRSTRQIFGLDRASQRRYCPARHRRRRRLEGKSAAGGSACGMGVPVWGGG